ncbi:sigma-70 family RNA polymerase sigma factor [Sphingomonas insulae]|uniref:Sigma-70 family RNA polymerase sigma factor n=1 Tax=Sphingomonas insulae TaxID=424800 RepID=A0ABN1HZB9_9SPHN
MYVLTSAKLFGICLRVCGDRTAAEDVLHDVYMIVWKRAGSYDPCLGSPISWLTTIARNRAIDWRRNQTRQAALPLDNAPDLPDPAIDTEAGMLLDEASRGIFASLAALESHQGDAIRNAFFHGFTYAELAERHCVPIGTMKSWIRRGLQQMRRNLELAGH